MTESKINFLWKAANSLPYAENYAAIRTYLLARCQDHAKHVVNLPKKLFSVSAMCQKCFTPWRFGQYQCTLRSAKKSNKKRKKSKNKPSKTLQNELSLCCNFCNNKNIITLDKPSKVIKEHKIEEITPCNKKRKKKKDKFAGLSAQAVLSADPKHLDRSTLRKEKRLDFINKDNKTPVSSLNVTRKQTNVAIVPRPIFKSEISDPKLGNIIVPKKFVKQKKNKLLSKVDNNKQEKANNSIKNLAEILKKSNTNKNSSLGLKQLLKSV